MTTMSQTLQNPWTRRLSSIAVTGIFAASMTLAAPQPAKADHPVVVAVIGAGAVLGAALIGAAGVVGAAVITGAADVTGAAINANSNGGPEEGDEGGSDGGGGDGGGEEESGDGLSGARLAAALVPRGCYATMAGGSIAGPSDFLEIDQSAVPVDMQAFMSRNIQLMIDVDQTTQSLGANATYSFDGDVMKSPGICDYIYNSDTISWDLSLTQNPNSSSDYFLFHFENLLLTTTDVPDTLGRSAVEFKVYQGPNEIWSWSAAAYQGQPSVHGPVPAFSTVTQSPGELQIENFLEAIPVTFPAGSNQTNVTLVMTYAGRGART